MLLPSARLNRLVRPMPPTPTPAMFNRSLGAVKPWPRTWRGTIVKAAVEAATLVTKSRREIIASSFQPLNPLDLTIVRVAYPKHRAWNGLFERSDAVGATYS